MGIGQASCLPAAPLVPMVFMVPMVPIFSPLLRLVRLEFASSRPGRLFGLAAAFGGWRLGLRGLAQPVLWWLGASCMEGQLRQEFHWYGGKGGEWMGWDSGCGDWNVSVSRHKTDAREGFVWWWGVGGNAGKGLSLASFSLILVQGLD